MKQDGILDAWVSRVVTQQLMAQHVLGYELSDGTIYHCVFGHLLEIAVERGLLSRNRLPIEQVKIVEEDEEGGVPIQTMSWLIERGVKSIYVYGDCIRSLPISFQATTGIDPFLQLDLEGSEWGEAFAAEPSPNLTILNDSGLVSPVKLAEIAYRTYH